MSKIRERTKNRSTWKRINRKTNPGFTYRDLKQMLVNAQATEVGAFRINLDLSVCYIMLLSRSIGTTMSQIIIFFLIRCTQFEKIVSLDLGEIYYLRRPTSGWVLVGLPNVQIYIMRMRDIPIDVWYNHTQGRARRVLTSVLPNQRVQSRIEAACEARNLRLAQRKFCSHPQRKIEKKLEIWILER